jgi:hypothetical protein
MFHAVQYAPYFMPCRVSGACILLIGYKLHCIIRRKKKKGENDKTIVKSYWKTIHNLFFLNFFFNLGTYWFKKILKISQLLDLIVIRSEPLLLFDLIGLTALN